MIFKNFVNVQSLKNLMGFVLWKKASIELCKQHSTMTGQITNFLLFVRDMFPALGFLYSDYVNTTAAKY